MSTSNIFSNVFIYGNCTVQGTFTSLGGSAVSQWTTSGSTIYYSSGNVGIGTAAPVSTFEVTGTGFPGTALTRTAAGDNYGVGIQYSLISNTGSFRGYYARAFGGSLGTIATTNQNQANGYFGIDVANAGLFASDTYGYAGVQFYVAPTISVFNTRVGIGTTNPGSLLTVSGGVGIGSGYNAFTAPTGGLIVQGNVGIGTSNPGVNALQVTGNVVTSGFTSNATNTVFNYDTLTVPFLNATQVGIGVTTPQSPLHVNAIVGGNGLTIGPDTPYVTSGSMFGLAIINSTLTSGQSSVIQIGKSVTDTMFISYNYTGTTAANYLAFAGYGYSTNGSLCIRNDGKVGIGTSNPTRPFHLYGSMRLDMNVASYSTQSATQAWTGGTWYQLVAPGALTNLGQASTIPTTYLISMTWQTTANNPYNLYCSFLYNCGWCNDTNANQLSGAPVPTSYHATNNAGDFQVSIRGNATGSNYTGFDFKVNATTTTGYWVVKAMIISYY